MIVRTQGHCPRGILAWPTQITSNTPSPAIVPLHRYRKTHVYEKRLVKVSSWETETCMHTEIPATWRPECRCVLDPQTPAPTRAAPRSVPISFRELEKQMEQQ